MEQADFSVRLCALPAVGFRLNRCKSNKITTANTSPFCDKITLRELAALQCDENTRRRINHVNLRINGNIFPLHINM